ncbi:MAG: hypothetical protein JXB48_11445 [Candidatus Latescibacteria bacterium]|nr:hypothetical protein [Candidatus Latescibacterota bacterium]
MKKNILKPFFFPLPVFIILMMIFITGCGKKEPVDENVHILQRIPENNVLIVSVKPTEILKSPFIAALSSLNEKNKNNFDEYREKESEFRKLTGIDPAKDIERIMILSEDLRNFPQTWSIIAQGNLKMTFLDSLLTKAEIPDSMIVVRGFDVHYLKARNNGNFLKLYMYFDDHEVMMTSNESILDKMLGLKKGSGNSIADSEHFKERYASLKYTDHIWFMLPVEGLMNDVMAKIRTQRPDFKLDIQNITDIQGSVGFGNDAGLSLQAYCSDTELVGLFADTINGFIAMGKLTVGAVPQIREVLNSIEVTEQDKLLECNVKVPVENLIALQALKNLNQ